MEPQPVRFTLGKQSSLAPERGDGDGDGEEREIDPRVRLMYLANEGDLEGAKELLDSGTDVNYRDIDGRTALHIAACQGSGGVVELLLRNGAEVDPEDRWGSTPLADAIHYKKHDAIKLLEKHGAKPLTAPMHVNNVRQVPEYEINPQELDFTNSVDITKGTFCIATWRGIQVAVKKLGEEVTADEDKVRAFRDELALLQKIRHPNVVQFLGAVTQSSPMMIVTEYLPKVFLILQSLALIKFQLMIDFPLNGLVIFLIFKEKRSPNSSHSCQIGTGYCKTYIELCRLLIFLEITVLGCWYWGMNYLHENRPEAIIHRDLEPSNILRDDSGCLKVADFGVSKLLKVTSRVKEDRPLTCQDNSCECRYVSPEVFKNEEYDTKVDVFSFALILQEVKANPARDDCDMIDCLLLCYHIEQIRLMVEDLRKRGFGVVVYGYGADCWVGGYGASGAITKRKEEDLGGKIENREVYGKHFTGHQLIVLHYSQMELQKDQSSVQLNKLTVYFRYCRSFDIVVLSLSPDAGSNEVELDRYHPKLDSNEVVNLDERLEDTDSRLHDQLCAKWEMIEGCLPFSAKQENDVPKAYAANVRPPFRAPAKHYAHGLKELIEECWNESPAKRPTFRQIISRLETIYGSIGHKRGWKVSHLFPFLSKHS
ncbi:hypothetical protein C3L33_06127, partial [Rhododendron williamsianum]